MKPVFFHGTICLPMMPVASECQRAPVAYRDSVNVPRQRCVSTKTFHEEQRKDNRASLTLLLLHAHRLADFVRLTLNASCSIPKAELNVVAMNSIQYKSDICTVIIGFCIRFNLVCCCAFLLYCTSTLGTLYIKNPKHCCLLTREDLLVLTIFILFWL